MSLRETYRHLFEAANLIPKIPTIPKIAALPPAEGNCRDIRDIRDTVEIPENGGAAPVMADENSGGFAFPLDGEPLPCIACTCWQRVPGLAWWCGRCAATGRSINTRSVCDCGFVDWQAAPVELRTAPQQQGEAGAEAVEATACAY